MATVASALDTVALTCAMGIPGSWIASNTRSAMEMRSILDIVVDELLDRVDWPDPITKDATITGDGSETYDLPSDFKRLTHDDEAVYEQFRIRRFAIPVTTNGDWTNLTTLGTGGGNRFYRMSGDEESGYSISLFPYPGTNETVTVSYVSKNWLSSSGTAGSDWITATDTLLLPKRMVELGCVWRWKQRKGLPFADVLAEYEARLARSANEHRRRTSICFGEPEPMKPMRYPVPDFIPSS